MQTLKIIQLISSILLIALVLLQQRGSGVSSFFGGSGEFYATRRGFEKILFIATFVVLIILTGSVIAYFLLY